MKLVEAQVRNFRNVLDSTPVAIQNDITCLVGKNESGKTAFLHALYRVRPARPNATFSVPEHYPAWLEKRDRQKGIQLENFCPVRATFELDSADVQAIEKVFGSGVLTEPTLTMERTYSNELRLMFAHNESVAVKNVVTSMSFPSAVTARTSTAMTFDDLLGLSTELTEEEDEENIRSSEHAVQHSIMVWWRTFCSANGTFCCRPFVLRRSTISRSWWSGSTRRSVARKLPISTWRRRRLVTFGRTEVHKPADRAPTGA